MPSRNTYHLTWVSLTLDVGYLFTAAPAKHRHCSLPWMRDISSRLPLLTLDVGLLLLAASPDLGHVVTLPGLCPDLRRGVAPLGCPCADAAWHSQSLTMTLG